MHSPALFESTLLHDRLKDAVMKREDPRKRREIGQKLDCTVQQREESL